MAEARDLPGMPKKSLVKATRRWLASFGIRPTKDHLWRETWLWASQIARSYFHMRWPIPSEIAAQYVLLLMLHMHEQRALKLPYRAGEQIPDHMKPRLAGRLVIALPAPTEHGS
jgi:hypothetical protein